MAETAVSIARDKGASRGIDAEFMVADAFHLHRLGRVFETVLDCGLLHTFDTDERRDYVASLASVLIVAQTCTCSVSVTSDPIPARIPSDRRS